MKAIENLIERGQSVVNLILAFSLVGLWAAAQKAPDTAKPRAAIVSIRENYSKLIYHLRNAGRLESVKDINPIAGMGQMLTLDPQLNSARSEVATIARQIDGHKLPTEDKDVTLAAIDQLCEDADRLYIEIRKELDANLNPKDTGAEPRASMPPDLLILTADLLKESMDFKSILTQDRVPLRSLYEANEAPATLSFGELLDKYLTPRVNVPVLDVSTPAELAILIVSLGSAALLFYLVCILLAIGQIAHNATQGEGIDWVFFMPIPGWLLFVNFAAWILLPITPIAWGYFAETVRPSAVYGIGFILLIEAILFAITAMKVRKKILRSAKGLVLDEC